MSAPASLSQDVLDAIGGLEAVERLFESEPTIFLSGEVGESALNVLREIVTDAMCAAYREQLDEGPVWRRTEWTGDIYARADRILRQIDEVELDAS
jgi:hypothetical protein